MISGYGGARQNGLVVDDLDQAIAGPFYVVRYLPLKSFRDQGRNSAPDLSIGLGKFGDLQIELIQQRNEAYSPYRSSGGPA